MFALVLPFLLVACGGSGEKPVFTFYSDDTPQMILDDGYLIE